MSTRSRPLSPHLQVYRFTITMAMSIVHRITGIANAAGTILLVAWLAAAALGEGPLEVVNGVFGSWIGQVILFGFSWSLIHHMLGGLRYFAWDRIIGFDPGIREAMAWANLIGSVVLTILVWAIYVWF